jgi:biopolymer transport protein ExbD
MVKRRHQDPGIDPDINRVITPMLDLAFQVLLFFILTYHPSQLQEGQMDLSLPDTDTAQAKDPKDVDPKLSMPGGELDLPSEVTVIVKTQHDDKALGQIKGISVQDKVNIQEVETPQALRQYLEKLRPGLGNSNDIKIQADSGLKYSNVMEIMDTCTRAGFKNVSFGPPADVGGG